MISKNKLTISLATCAISVCSLQADALPRNANGTVISGAATIVDTTADRTTINQTSDVAEINWSNFDLTNTQRVDFNVPRSESLSINRVTSGIASEIAGRITSNGQIYLINEHGMNFHNGAYFSAETFAVSTIDTFNAEADANQYAKLTFDSLASDGGFNVNNFVAIAPFIGFYTTTSWSNLTRYYNKKIVAANRATVNFAGVDNELAVDVPDVQPDIVVPGIEKLGIEVVSSSGNGIFFMSDTTEMVAKAVSVAQNIDSLINLDGRAGSGVYLRTYQHPSRNAAVVEYDFDLFSDGHILLQGDIGFSTLTSYGTPVTSTDARTMNVKLVAGKNLFFTDYTGGINKTHFEAGHNLILNAGNTLFDHSYGEGAYGERIIKLGSGTLSIESGDYNFGTLADIETYAAGTIGHVEDFWVGKQDYVKPADNATFTYYGPDANIAIKTTIDAPNIDVNSDIDLTGATTERAWKSGFSYDRDHGGMTGIINYTYFADPGAGNGEIAPLTFNTTGDVNINANVRMDGMGDFNITALNYNVNGMSVVDAGTSSVNFTLYAPPPPPPPPPPVVVPTPTPDPEPTFEDLIGNVSNEVMELVKEKFYESFDSGSQTTVEQQVSAPVMSQDVVTAQNVSEPKSVDKVEAASCSGGVCAVLDKEDQLVTIDEAYLEKRARLKLKSLADRVVNLTGMVDVFKF